MRGQTRERGNLYDRATAFMLALEGQETAAAQDMLAAWSDAYWATRQELDTLMAKVAAARAAGVPVNRAWLLQRGRLQTVLASTKAEMTRYAAQGAQAVTAQQRRAVAAAQKDAARLASAAVTESLPGLAATLVAPNPENLARLVGFLGDGTPLDRLARSMGDDAAHRLRDVLTKGITLGWGQDRMVRAFTDGLAVTHARAVTILRTESLRVYRETSRQTYAANPDVLTGWVWTCALDRRSCVACIAMHGTEHDAEDTLDGHPRCRCAMTPRTVSWADLGLDGLPDTRPSVQSGADWFAAQSPTTQRAILGRGKYDAWARGDLTLDDMVARRFDPDWGTMRSERSLVAIREGRDANWFGRTAPEPEALPSRYTPEQMESGEAIYRMSNPAQRAKYMAQFAPGGELADAGMYARLLAVQADLDATPAWMPPWATMDPEAWDDAVKNTNPNWQGKGNCSNVTTAWELRRRGWDVKAHQDQDGRQLPEILAAWGQPRYQRSTWLQADKAIVAQFGEGARGAIVCQWKGGGGHIFNWEVRDGRVHWIESQNQSGEYDLAWLRERTRNQVWWFRLDDMPETEDLNDYLEGHRRR